MHRLGSVLAVPVPITTGPGSATPPSGINRWDHSFAIDPLALFVMLHFEGSQIGPADQVVVDLGYDTDVYTSAWGPDFWSRPIRGDTAVTWHYIAAPGSTGRVTLDKYGRGEAARGDATNAVGYRNTNADVFLIDSPYIEPLYFSSQSVTSGHSAPSWVIADCVSDAVVRQTARSVGMYVHIDNVGKDEVAWPEDGTPPVRLSSCTATLIAPDLVITAGHCIDTDEDVKTGWITFDWETKCGGARPVPYNPQFYKMKRLVRTGYTRLPGDSRPVVDYSILQIETPAGGIGRSPIASRPSSAPLIIDEPLFIVHQRRGTPKKVSRYPLDGTCEILSDAPPLVGFSCSVDHGSSGSSVFDALGRIVANLSRFDGGQSITSIWNDFTTEPPPVRDIDVVLVFDRSGSMSLPGFAGAATKIEEARRAAALFVSLLRTDHTHRVGLVSFSTKPSSDYALAGVGIGTSTKMDLIGPIPPATAGLVGGITPGGSTTIGSGLRTALGQLPMPSPTTNTRAILLMTDGLENTPEWIINVEPALQSADPNGLTRLSIVGFGTDASVDGPRLTTLARNHGGIYTRADEGLALKKFFALSFGRIFDLGTNLDPEYVFPAGAYAAAPVEVQVCGETMLTVVLGWVNPNSTLFMRVIGPGGITIDRTTPGIITESGDTWSHMRVPLPFAGEQDGTWKVVVFRPRGGGEFPGPAPEERYFLTVLVDGGPAISPVLQPLVYTGDVINPKVFLRNPNGGRVDGTITVEISAPTNGTGNILMGNPLIAPTSLGGDPLDQRASTLIALEQAHGSALVPVAPSTVTLFDDGAHDDGGIEPDGIHGLPIPDLARHEGNYTFHARATYGTACVAKRETTWSTYVAVGVDPSTTSVTTKDIGGLPGRRRRVEVTITPRDKWGNYLGPGRGGSLETGGAPGSKIDGGLTDNGDGSYTQIVVWKPGKDMPSATIRQQDRPAVVIVGPKPSGGGRGKPRPHDRDDDDERRRRDRPDKDRDAKAKREDDRKRESSPKKTSTKRKARDTDDK